MKDNNCCEYKHIPRDAKGIKSLESRINKMMGQLSGIKAMINDNRYCGDILIQISALTSALQSLANVIFKEHLETCVVEKINNGDTKVIEETMDLIKKLK